MKVYFGAIVVAISGFVGTSLTSTVEAGGCCKRHCPSTCGTAVVVHCCHCGSGSKSPAPESARRESSSRGRSVGYVVESAPVMTYGMMPMMMPLAYGTATVQAAGFRVESATARRESSETERTCQQLAKDVSKLSEEVDKLIKVVDKQGLALEAIVKKLQEKDILDK